MRFSDLVKQALSDEYLQDVGQTTALTTLGVGGAAGAGAGYYVHKKLNPQSVEDLAERVGRSLAKQVGRVRTPVAIGLGMLTGLMAAEKLGLPAGVLLGLISGGDEGRGRPPGPFGPPPPPPMSEADYILGRRS